MSDLQELTNELMQDPEFVKEYEAIQPEVNITRAILDARINAGMTQVELYTRYSAYYFKDMILTYPLVPCYSK